MSMKWKGNNHNDFVQQNGIFYKIATSPKQSQMSMFQCGKSLIVDLST